MRPKRTQDQTLGLPWRCVSVRDATNCAITAMNTPLTWLDVMFLAKIPPTLSLLALDPLWELMSPKAAFPSLAMQRGQPGNRERVATQGVVAGKGARAGQHRQSTSRSWYAVMPSSVQEYAWVLCLRLRCRYLSPLAPDPLARHSSFLELAFPAPKGNRVDLETHTQRERERESSHLGEERKRMCVRQHRRSTSRPWPSVIFYSVL